MNSRPWAAVLFDFGGTLDGDGIHWSRRFDSTFRSMELSYAPEALDDAFRASERVVNSDPAVKAMNLPAVIRYQCALMLRDLGHPTEAVADDAGRRLTLETRDYLGRNSAVLRLLKGRVKTGILSNFTGNLEIILREEGLLALVDSVFDSAVVGLRKPDPAFFRHALSSLGAAPGETAMVGDSVDMDLRPAGALGLSTVWIQGAIPRATDFRPDHTLENVREFPSLWGETI